MLRIAGHFDLCVARVVRLIEILKPEIDGGRFWAIRIVFSTARTGSD